MRKVAVYLIDEAKKEFEGLNRIIGEQTARGIGNSEEMQLLASIKNKIEILKLNPVYGDQVPKRLWPKELVSKHRLTNLWRVELTNYWRMLYTLRGDKVELICFIIELIDHKKYDRLFGYKKR